MHQHYATSVFLIKTKKIKKPCSSVWLNVLHYQGQEKPWVTIKENERGGEEDKELLEESGRWQTNDKAQQAVMYGR